MLLSLTPETFTSSRAKGEKAKLMESREFLEKCNQRLLIDMESLKSRKNDLENKVAEIFKHW